jgi:hypothetical protein
LNTTAAIDLDRPSHVEREPKGLRLKRGGSPDEFFVPWDKIVGKMLFSHFSPDAPPKS